MMILHKAGNLNVGDFLADGDQGKKDGDTDYGLSQFIGNVALLVADVEIGEPRNGDCDTGDYLYDVHDFLGKAPGVVLEVLRLLEQLVELAVGAQGNAGQKNNQEKEFMFRDPAGFPPPYPCCG